MTSTNPPATIPDGDVKSTINFSIEPGVIDTAYKRGTGSNGQINLGVNDGQYDFLVSHAGNDTSYNFWLNITSLAGQNQFILSSWTDDFNPFGVQIVADTTGGGNGTMDYNTQKSVGGFLFAEQATNYILTDNLFHMYTLVVDHDDGTLDWYRDGVFFEQDTGGTECIQALIDLNQCRFEKTLQLGDILDSSPEHGCPNCSFDEMSIWNRNLTQADITILYNSGAGFELDNQTGIAGTGPQVIVSDSVVVSLLTDVVISNATNNVNVTDAHILNTTKILGEGVNGTGSSEFDLTDLEIYYKMEGTSMFNELTSNLGSQGKGNQVSLIGTPTFQVAGLINNGIEADASGDGVSY